MWKCPGAWWENVTALACLYKICLAMLVFPFCTPCIFVVWLSCCLFLLPCFSQPVFSQHKPFSFLVFPIVLWLQCRFVCYFVPVLFFSWTSIELNMFVLLWFICLCNLCFFYPNWCCPASWVSEFKCKCRMKY